MYGRNIGLFEIDLFKNGTDDHLYVTSTKMFELKGIVLFILFIFYLKPYRSDYVADWPFTLTLFLGDTGINAWQKATIYIGRRKEPFYITFTAHVGGNPSGVTQEHTGDISIDEIQFKNCGRPDICSGNFTGRFL